MDKIKRFNGFVKNYIRENGTCKIAHLENDRIAVFEADASVNGFVGWWDDDHSQMTHADTPFEVYCDMP
mgnify:CR=1 FL=1